MPSTGPSKSYIKGKRATLTKKLSSIANPKKRKALDPSHFTDSSDEEIPPPAKSRKRTRGVSSSSTPNKNISLKTRTKKSKPSLKDFGDDGDDDDEYNCGDDYESPSEMDDAESGKLNCTPCSLLDSTNVNLAAVVKSKCLCSDVHCQDAAILRSLTAEYEGRITILCSALEDNWSHLFNSSSLKSASSRVDHIPLPILHPMSPPSRTISSSSLDSSSSSFATPLSLYPTTSTYSKKQYFVRLIGSHTRVVFKHEANNFFFL